MQPQIQPLTPRTPRYDTLDMWRCIACLAVVAFHATAISHYSYPSRDVPGLVVALTARGWMGVPVFFVISGYCIGATVDAAKTKPRGGRDFFVRRFRRIYPPFWACLAISTGFAQLLHVLRLGHLVTGQLGYVQMLPDFSQLRLRQWAGNLALAEMWRHHLDGVSGVVILGQTWTLCYEVQFYAAAGLLLILAPRRFFPGALLVSLAVVACGPLGLDHKGLMWDGRWLLFATGLGIYYAINYAGRRGKTVMFGVLAAGIAYGIARRFDLLPASVAFRSLHRSEALAAFLFAAVMLALHRHDARLVAWRPVRPLLFLGRISYSIYLIHLPIVLAISHALFIAGLKTPVPTLLITLPLCTAAAVFCGWLFYLGVERRFMGSASKKTAPAAAGENGIGV